MAMRILWPNLSAQFVPIATKAVGPGFETEFREKFEDVTDKQWAARFPRDGRLTNCVNKQFLLAKS